VIKVQTGIDLVKIDSFTKLMDNETFINNNFNESEINYLHEHYSTQTLAGLYASKEALLKALKKGINNYSLKDIEINHDSNSAPYIILHNKIKEDFNVKDISLSISHDGDYAIAIVLLII
jgi:phosphopantetheine--protein transferase-like protein